MTLNVSNTTAAQVSSTLEYSSILTDTILVALTDAPSARNGVLLPRLAHLTLGRCLGGSPGIFGKMILSRRIPCHNKDLLQTLAIHQLEEFDEQALI